MPIKLNDKLIGLPETSQLLKDIRARFPEGEDGTDEFLPYVGFLQYGLPFGELKLLKERDFFPRKHVVLDPETARPSAAPTSDMTMFNRYATSEKIFDKGYSFMFLGPNGSGKTLLALRILCGQIERGHSGYYLHWKDYMATFNEASFQYTPEEKVIRDHVNNCGLLVIDEIGKESKVSANVVGELERLLKDRAASLRPTIIITNLPLFEVNKQPGFVEKYGNSVHNVMLHKYKFVQFSVEGNFRVRAREEWEI